MADTAAERTTLLFAYGNLSRGDDALAPLFLESIRGELARDSNLHFRYLQDYQIQIEHVVDMQGCESVLLLDADQSQDQPIRFYCITEQPGHGYTTHGMTPGQLLSVYRKMYQQDPPPTFMLSIRGYEFELGKPVSDAACRNLETAKVFFQQLLQAESSEEWLRFCS